MARFLLNRKTTISEVEKFLNDNFEDFLNKFREQITIVIKEYILENKYFDIEEESAEVLYDIVETQAHNYMYNVYLPSLYTVEEDLGEAECELVSREDTLIYNQTRRFLNKAEKKALKISAEIYESTKNC